MTRISRRQFNALSAGAVAAVALGPSPARAEPKRGGRFRLGVGGTNPSESWDPGTWGTSTMMGVGAYAAIYNCLTEIGPDGSLVPELAQSFDVDHGAKRWAFRIRKGVTFSDGRTLTAEDVVASINHHRGEQSGSAAKAIVSSIAEIKADGPDLVVVELDEGNADFAYLMSDYHLVIGPSEGGKVNWDAHIGTGGYVMTEYSRGTRMLLTRRSDYWKEGRAWFDEYEVIGISDVTARTTALITGAVDAIGRADTSTLDLLERRDDVVIDEVTGTQHFTMPMFCDVAPFDDIDVRTALKLAANREEMVQKILHGHGRVGNDHPIAPANRYFAEDLPQREYDPEKARFHLKKAGAEGLKVRLHAADAAYEGAVNTAVLYREHAAAAGIDVEIVREPDDGYWSDVWTKKPFVMCFWNGRPTEDWMFSQVYSSGAEWNDTHWKNPTFDSLLTAARTELDEAKRREMYREMQRLVRDDGGVIVPMYANYVMARSSRVARGDSIGANADLDGWKCGERWWFA